MRLDQAARAVLQCYPGTAGNPVCLGNRGGFSGARLWRLEGPFGALCLRAGPPSGSAPEHVAVIHGLMRQATQAGLSFVPTVLPTRNGQTVVTAAGRVWELMSWMPGQADFHQRPGEPRLRSACGALARLHRVWSATSSCGPCPAVRQRLEAAHDWTSLTAAGWQPPLGSPSQHPIPDWAGRAWRQLARHAGRVAGDLADWADRPTRLQPCLCDVWHDHLLFQDDRISGVVDYAAVKVNHVAADLARLLGSFVGDDRRGWQVGLDAYQALAPLSAEEAALAELLDRTGTVLGAASWLRRLYVERQAVPDRGALVARLGALVLRMERWPCL